MLGGPPDTSDPLSREGLILDHRFRLDRYLGAGSVHTVFAARDLLEDQAVCVKLPRKELRGNPGFTLRYRRDVTNVMMHRSPGWVTPLLLAEHDGAPFQVLPLIYGQTLPQWYKESGRDHEALLEIVKIALYHLAQMHRMTGRIHGSIKPENLLVTLSGEAVFCDLVATGRLEDQFAEKARTGEPVYFSPEQLVGERAGPPCDIYSLGLVLYTTLASRHPFGGPVEGDALSRSPGLGHPERLLASMLSQLQERPAAASSFREDVPRWADRFLARCLLPRPEDRFAAPEDALDWLRHHARKADPPSSEHRPLPPAGREQEMSFLMECLEDVLKDPPAGNIIRLHGAPGVGKTRCTEWLKEQARRHDVRIVDVQQTPESGLHLQSVATALRSSVPPEARPAAEEPVEARPVVEHLIEAALEGPVLLLLDDMTQADETLMRLLDELTSVLGDLPVLVVLSEDGSTFRTAAVQEFMESLDHVLILTPLDRRAVANLIEERAWSPPSANLAAWVHRVSEGNALAARLLVDYLLANGHLKDEITLDWAKSPSSERPDLCTLLAWKLGRVSASARALLETGAVLGDPFNLSTLQAITYRDPEEVDAAISEAVKAEILEVGARAGATTYRWAHPLLRQTLWQSLAPRRRQRIHRLAAAFYSRGEPEPAKLAYHFLQSGDTRELLVWGIQAVERARRLGRRGEGNYWLNVLLDRIDPARWLGPSLEKARQDNARDQSEMWDLDTWSRWLRALAGRAAAEYDSLDLCDLHYAVQVLLDAPWPWPAWRRGVVAVVAEIGERTRRDAEALAPYRKALALLRGEWFVRAGSGEPFPKGTD
jgi:serine/threonine protein kinase